MNITYLLGAGASYEAIPIVEGIPNALDSFYAYFKPGTLDDLKRHDRSYEELSPIQQFIINSDDIDTKWREVCLFSNNILLISEEANRHKSIDTYAKKLFLKKDYKRLQNLKAILSCFFLFLQSNEKDKRYDSFLASILDDLSELPGNLKILSWNYDSQLEIAFDDFLDLKNITESKKRLNTHSKGDVVYDAYATDQFCVYKLNGTTTFTEGEFRVLDAINDFNQTDNLILKSILDLYNDLVLKNNKSNLSFAWEDFNQKRGFYPNLRKSIEETEILIIIGYSFPFFNRNIDRFIFDSMPNLKKVYVQDPNHANDIIEKIKGMVTWDKSFTRLTKNGSIVNSKKTIDFLPKQFVDQFFIPIEF